jgi:hypothetical protein
VFATSSGSSGASSSPGTVLMQGWLEKKGSKRWFQLTGMELSW